MSLTHNQSGQEPGRPETALSREMVKPGDRIKTYIPREPDSVRRYEIIHPPKESELVTEDSRGDMLVWIRDLDTDAVSHVDTASLGLTCGADGTRYCWAIPDDE